MTKNHDSQDVGIPVAVVVANDDGHYTSAPLAAPAPQVYFHERHTHHAEESTKRRGLFATAMSTAGVSFALILAHGYGMMFNIFAFCFLICLTSVGLGMLPAACVGVVILLALKGLLRPIAKMDEKATLTLIPTIFRLSHTSSHIELSVQRHSAVEMGKFNDKHVFVVFAPRKRPPGTRFKMKNKESDTSSLWVSIPDSILGHHIQGQKAPPEELSSLLDTLNYDRICAPCSAT
ncbi:hypothetical protein AC1031_015958 [Aphanomyces cochlioides]|nr:hypothetical protein AC1031_015958 [Aphanomyces cochlioides]